MKDTKQYQKVTVIFSTLVFAFVVFLFASVIVTPFTSDHFGESTVKIIIIFITIIASCIFWLITLGAKSDSVYHIMYGSSETNNSLQKKWLLIVAAMAFFMAPFGFAGILEKRGGGMFSPLYGGSLCLISGMLLLYFYHKRK